MKNIIIILLILAISGCNEQIPMPKLSNDAVILAFGDSLTYGTGASREQNYPKLLSNLTSVTVINAGIPGETTPKGLKRLPRLLDQYQPELIILIHGGNDMLKKIPRKKTAANLNQMIDAATQRNIAVLMLGVPQPGLFFLSSAEIYAEIADVRQIPIDLEILPEILSNNSLKSDLIHPNDAGYKLMAETIYNLLQERGALE